MRDDRTAHVSLPDPTWTADILLPCSETLANSPRRQPPAAPPCSRAANKGKKKTELTRWSLSSIDRGPARCGDPLSPLSTSLEEKTQADFIRTHTPAEIVPFRRGNLTP